MDGMNEESDAKIIRFPGHPRMSGDLATRLDDAFRALDKASSELHDKVENLHHVTRVLAASLSEIADNMQVLDTDPATTS